MLLVSGLYGLFHGGEVARADKSSVIFSDFEDPSVWDISPEKGFALARSTEYVTQGNYSLKVSFPIDSWPSINTKRLIQKFSEYEHLSVDIYNPQQRSIGFGVRVDDIEGNKFTVLRRLVPKFNQVRVSYSELRRRIMPGKIRRVVLFLDHPSEEQTLFFDNLRFVSASGAKALSKKTAQADARPIDGSGHFLKTRYGELEIFPRNNPWNQDVSRLPVHPRSSEYIKSIGWHKPLHPDFGTVWKGAPSGIPFVVVSGEQKKVPVKFRYASESDPGPYPIPDSAPIEGGNQGKRDRHVIVVDYHNKKLYELWSAYKTPLGWDAGSGAIFDLTSNRLRPAGLTSADAAGLPILPGLVRYDEVVERGEIAHALRFTAVRTRRAYIHPARHFASRYSDENLPPMGLRLRLKSDYNISRFPPRVQVILRALKTYGMILADNGGDWFISGVPDPRWNDDELRWIKMVRGRDLEAVFTGHAVTR